MRRNTSLRRIFVRSCTASTLPSQKHAAPCLARILLYFSALRCGAFLFARVRVVHSRHKNTPRLVLLYFFSATQRKIVAIHENAVFNSRP